MKVVKKRRSNSFPIKKYLLYFLLGAFVLGNILCYGVVYSFTHFKSPQNFSIGIPKPTNSKLPTDLGLKYTTQRIPVNTTEWLEAWFIPSLSREPQGTILLFPGNAGTKGKQLLPRALMYHNLGYDALLLDFRGVGGSSGNTITVGMREAKDVALVFQFAQRSQYKRPFILYGVSMGSAAILRSIAKQKIVPDGIILELPFARLINAVKSRLRAVKLPTFPLGEMMVFWGSIQHRSNGFTHNPVTYAKEVTCPTLLLHGKLDRWTPIEEVNAIFMNLKGYKQLVVFPNTGHHLPIKKDKELLESSVNEFLQKI